MRIPLASSGLREIDIKAATETLNSGNLTMGSRVKQFEADIAQYLGAKHFVMMNSGSSANLAMIEALLRPAKGKPKLIAGDTILVPAIAWPTTVWPIIQLGLNPIFVDVDPLTLALDLESAQEAINQHGVKIRGIFPIHSLGRAMSPNGLEKFIKKNELINLLAVLLAQTRYQTLMVARVIFREALERDLITQSPAASIKSPRIDVKPGKFLTWEDLLGIDFGKQTVRIQFLALHGLRWAKPLL